MSANGRADAVSEHVPIGAARLRLVPRPRRLIAQHGVVPLGTAARIWADPSLVEIVTLFVDDVASDGGPELALALDQPAFIVVRLGEEPADLAALADPVGVSPTGGALRREGYALEVTREGVTIVATAAEGARHGLTTLRQLIATAERDAEGRVLLPHLRIADLPALAWRGLSVDIARRFFGPEPLGRVIDMLALYKANVLHLHLSDHEGWRLQSTRYPELTASAPRDSFLTGAELHALSLRAAARGITLVPEIDVPGHSSSAARALPQLAGATGVVDPERFALDPRLPETMPFVRAVFAELAELVPGPFLHVGGDETLGMEEALYTRFMGELLPFIRSLGKQVIGWQELARAAVGPGDLVQYWISLEGAEPETADAHESEESAFFREVIARAPLDLEHARSKGARVILSPITAAYFDTAFADDVPAEQQERITRLGFPAYAPRSLQAFYEWHPLDVLPDPGMVAGAEAAVWGELLRDHVDLELSILPRLPGFAERAWAPECSWADYRERVGGHAAIWRARGWSFTEVGAIDWDGDR